MTECSDRRMTIRDDSSEEGKSDIVEEVTANEMQWRRNIWKYIIWWNEGNAVAWRRKYDEENHSILKIVSIEKYMKEEGQ